MALMMLTILFLKIAWLDRLWGVLALVFLAAERILILLALLALSVLVDLAI